ncbi:MAG: glycosyltransferase family 39 protein [Candidatus Kerfeldbacteria bacterium]|nr:glycosyltransferase family 39 protein [Candidatus Kerfeldbacteria bacterium]
MEHERRHNRVMLDVLACALALCLALFGVIPFVLNESSLPPLGVLSRAVMGALVVGSLLLWGFSSRIAMRVHALSLRRIMLWSSVFVLIFLLLPPIGSADLWNYVVRVREWVVAGLNPFIIPSSAISHDIFFPLSPPQWHGNTLNYGPLWLLLMAPVETFARDSLFAHLVLYRLVPAVAFLVSVWMVHHLAEQYAPSRARAVTILYAWNPLLLFEAVNNGHNDMVMVMLILAAWLCLVRRRAFAVLPLLAASFLVKYLSLLLIPFAIVLLWKSGRNGVARAATIAGGGLVGVLLAIVAFSPFWEGLATLSGIVTQQGYFVVQYQSPFSFLGFLVLSSAGFGMDQALMIVSRISVSLFALWYAWALFSGIWRGYSLGEFWFRAGLGYLLFASFLVAPWFVVWVIPFGLLSSSRRVAWMTALLTIAAFLSYALPFLSLLLLIALVALFGFILYHRASHVLLHSS